MSSVKKLFGEPENSDKIKWMNEDQNCSKCVNSYRYCDRDYMCGVNDELIVSYKLWSVAKECQLYQE